MTWTFLESGAGTGQHNMNTDEALALALLRGEGVPTVRVYGWNPWAISLGWNQSLDEILTDRVSADGLDVVRRPTGGRAVLHARELTYSVVMHAEGRGVAEVYRLISEGLLRAVRKLGVNAGIETRMSDVSAGRSAACFVATARSEIVVGSQKLAGSAQRRYGISGKADVVLQHGSLLLGSEHMRIVEYLRLPEERKSTLREELRRRSTDVSSVLGRIVGFEEAAVAVRQGFEEAWGMRFHSPRPKYEHETAAP